MSHMLLKPDTLALAGTFTTVSGRPLVLFVECGGPSLGLAGLRLRLLHMATGVAIALQEDVKIDFRRLAIGSDGATLDGPPTKEWKLGAFFQVGAQHS